MKRITSALLVALSSACGLFGTQAAEGNVGGAQASQQATTPMSIQAPAAPRAAHAGRIASACPYANVRPSVSNLRAIAMATVCLVNRERARRHLAALKANGELGAIAAKQAHDMVVGGYFGDNSITGQTPLQRVVASRYGSGHQSLLIGQNIGWGIGASTTPSAMVRSWMASAPHRRIMLRPGYQDMGAGVAPAPPRHPVHGGKAATYVLVLARHAS